MSFRITGNMMFKKLLSNVQTSTAILGDLQEQMVSLRRINRPSDDPTGASRVEALRTGEHDYTQYMKNIDQARGLLDYTASLLESASNQVVAARGKLMAAINPTADDISRQVLSSEIDSILKSMVGQANSKYAGKYIFGGTQTADPPFEITSGSAKGIEAVAFNGNSGRVRYVVGIDHQVEVNEDPVEVFAARGEANGLFKTLIDTRILLQNPDNLEGGDLSRELSNKLEDMDAVHNDIVRALGRVGTRSKSLQARRDLYTQAEISSAATRSEIEDADIADVALRLQNQQMIFQVILSGSAAVYNSNLMEFLR